MFWNIFYNLAHIKGKKILWCFVQLVWEGMHNLSNSFQRRNFLFKSCTTYTMVNCVVYAKNHRNGVFKNHTYTTCTSKHRNLILMIPNLIWCFFSLSFTFNRTLAFHVSECLWSFVSKGLCLGKTISLFWLSISEVLPGWDEKWFLTL